MSYEDFGYSTEYVEKMQRDDYDAETQRRAKDAYHRVGKLEGEVKQKLIQLESKIEELEARLPDPSLFDIEEIGEASPTEINQYFKEQKAYLKNDIKQIEGKFPEMKSQNIQDMNQKIKAKRKRS